MAEAPARPALLLVVAGDGDVRRVRLVRGQLVIGRSAECRLRLSNRSVSAEHAVIAADGGGWVIEDLASRNGTLVNGKAIARRRLRDRDLIQIGPHRMVFHAGGDDDSLDDDVEPSVAGDAATVAGDAAAGVERGYAVSNAAAGVAEGGAGSDEAAGVAEGGAGADRYSIAAGTPRAPARHREAVNDTLHEADWNAVDAGNAVGDGARTTGAGISQEPAPAEMQASASDDQDQPPSAEQTHARLRFAGGPRAGEELALTLPFSSLGHGGVLVAWIGRDDAGYWLLPAGASTQLTIDGGAVASAPTRLENGNVISIRGTEINIEFLY